MAYKGRSKMTLDSLLTEESSKAVSGIKNVAEYLGKPKAECSPMDYTRAGIAWIRDNLGDVDTERLIDGVLNYLEKYKSDKTSKAGKPLADIGGYSPILTTRAMGALYGDRKIAAVLYTICGWFDTEVRLQRLKACVKADAGKVAKGKAK
jgi:hypothetical protein